MLTISAQIDNSRDHHHVTLQTNDQQHSITIPSNPGGFGSSANGGELLFLALATCYCNDIYREAARRNITVRGVHVEVSGDFEGIPGNAAKNITYRARVEADAPEEAIHELMLHTDTVAEIQNTLRQASTVTLVGVEAVSV